MADKGINIKVDEELKNKDYRPLAKFGSPYRMSLLFLVG